jgi:hypothetical protein
MSRMSELYTSVQEQLEMGNSPYVVAKRLMIPVEWVLEIEADLNGEIPVQ